MQAYIFGSMKLTRRLFWFYAMVILYIVTGLNHFVNPGFYENMMPAYIPFHKACVTVSGICEIGLALLLIPELTRRIAAWLIISMLIVFFIVHIQMIIDYWNEGGAMLWVAILRFPLQFVLIRWAYRYAKTYNKKPSAEIS
jgi:uncharacterized membrane protein